MLWRPPRENNETNETAPLSVEIIYENLWTNDLGLIVQTNYQALKKMLFSMKNLIFKNDIKNKSRSNNAYYYRLVEAVLKFIIFVFFKRDKWEKNVDLL